MRTTSFINLANIYRSLDQATDFIIVEVAAKFYNPAMADKPITVQEMGRLGGLARARKHGKNKLRKWGKLGGRPRKKAARK